MCSRKVPWVLLLPHSSGVLGSFQHWVIVCVGVCMFTRFLREFPRFSGFLPGGWIAYKKLPLGVTVCVLCSPV